MLRKWGAVLGNVIGYATESGGVVKSMTLYRRTSPHGEQTP